MNDVFSVYLHRLGVATVGELNHQQLQRYFLLALTDFTTGEVSLDELGALAGTAWSPPLPTDTPETVALKSALEACSELPFYLRKLFEGRAVESPLLHFLTQTIQYYQSNKHLV